MYLNLGELKTIVHRCADAHMQPVDNIVAFVKLYDAMERDLHIDVNIRLVNCPDHLRNVIDNDRLFKQYEQASIFNRHGERNKDSLVRGLLRDFNNDTVDAIRKSYDTSRGRRNRIVIDCRKMQLTFC